jgi:hypothetical protein
VFSSILGVQTLIKLGIILQTTIKKNGQKADNNHRLNCTANANTSKNCHHFKKVISCEHCLIPNVVLTLLQKAIHSQNTNLNDNYKSKGKNFHKL